MNKTTYPMCGMVMPEKRQAIQVAAAFISRFRNYPACSLLLYSLDSKGRLAQNTGTSVPRLKRAKQTLREVNHGHLGTNCRFLHNIYSVTILSTSDHIEYIMLRPDHDRVLAVNSPPVPGVIRSMLRDLSAPFQIRSIVPPSLLSQYLSR